MPRPLTPAVVTAITGTYVKPGFLVQITLLSGPLNLWSGVGTLIWNGIAFQGIGQFGKISTIEEGSSIQARGITLTLSGVDPTLLSDVQYEYAQGQPVLVWVALFDANNNILPNPISAWVGRTDQPTITVDGPGATIAIACENRLLEMNTSAERRYTTEDQQIDFPGDLGFSFTPMVQDVTLYWGRHPSSSNNFTVQGTG